MRKIGNQRNGLTAVFMSCNRGKRGFKSIRTLLTAAVDRIDMLSQQDNPLTGVSTGFSDLDDTTLLSRQVWPWRQIQLDEFC